MNYYLYVTSRDGKGRFLAATVNERVAITAVVVGLKTVYPREKGWESVEVYDNHPAQNPTPIHIFKF